MFNYTEILRWNILRFCLIRHPVTFGFSEFLSHENSFSHENLYYGGIFGVEFKFLVKTGFWQFFGFQNCDFSKFKLYCSFILKLRRKFCLYNMWTLFKKIVGAHSKYFVMKNDGSKTFYEWNPKNSNWIPGFARNEKQIKNLNSS